MVRCSLAWRLVLVIAVHVVVSVGCQPPPAPPATLSRFNPPSLQILPPPRLRTPPESLVFASTLADGVQIVPRIGHQSDVTSVAIRSDGELAASASRDGTVKLWDLHSGALLRTLSAGATVGVAILGDDKRLLTAGRDGRLRIWALATGQLLRTIAPTGEPSSASITAVALSPDGRRAAATYGADGGTLAIWDLETGKQIGQVATTSGVRALSFTVYGDAVFTGDDGGALKRFDGDALELSRTIAGHAREITTIAMSADGRRVLSASADGLVKLWDVASGALLVVLPAHSRPVRGVAVSQDASQAVSVAEDGAVKLWDLTNKRALVTMTGHGGAVTALTTVDGVRGVLTGGADGTLRRWDFAAREALTTIAAHEAAAAHASFSGSGRSALTVGSDGQLRLWDLSALSVTRQWDLGPRVSAAALSPDATTALTASSDTRGAVALHLWDMETGQPVHTFDVGSGNVVTSLTFSPRGTRALSGGMLGSVQLWGTAIRRPLRDLLGHTSPVRAAAISDDGRRGLTSAAAPMLGPDRVKLWDLDSGEELRSFDGYRVGTLAAGGAQAFVGSGDGKLAVFDLETGDAERTWEGHDRAVRAVAADARGRIFASADAGGVVKVWDNHRERLVRTLTGHQGAVHSLGFSADSERLMSVSEDGTLRVWRLETGASVALLARGDEWLAYSDDGHFTASPRGAELAYAVSGVHGFRLDQLAALHNRPDVLLERIGGGSTEQMADFEARHRRRLRDLGTTEQELARSYGNAPRVAITELAQRGRKLTVGFRVVSKTKATYQFLLNGVPWWAEPKLVGEEHLAESIPLLVGRNRLQIEVVDAAGARAIPATHVVRYEPEVTPSEAASGEPEPQRPRSSSSRGSLHYIGIGVSRYVHPGLRADYARRDAVTLGRVLEGARGAFRKVHIHTLVDEQATAEAIRALDRKLAQTAVEDTVVLFIAGHWAHTRSVPADTVFLPHDGEPQRLVGTTARFDALMGLLSGIRARRRLVIMDGCVSGDRDDEELRVALGEAARRGLIPRTSAALLPPRQFPPRSFLLQDQRLILGARAGEQGAVLLRASRGRELCYELDGQQSGVLTAAVIRALTTPDADTDANGWVTLDELQAYVGPAVANMTGGLQHPVLVRGGVEQNIELPRVRDVAPSTQVIDHPFEHRPPRACGCDLAGRKTGGGALYLALLLVVGLARRRAR